MKGPFRLWHEWRMSVWLDRVVAARRVVLFSPSPEAEARLTQCRERLLHHLDALGERGPL